MRFPHVSEIIFDHLDNQSLANCNIVSKTWSIYIREQKFYAIRREYADISGQDALLMMIAKMSVIQIATVEKVFVYKEENAKIVIGACVI